MRIALATLLLTCACLGGACSCEGEPKPAVEAEPPHAPAPQAPKPASVDPTPEQVPIPEDFEEQAAKEVSPEELGAQLDALEQEITADSQ